MAQLVFVTACDSTNLMKPSQECGVHCQNLAGGTALAQFMPSVSTPVSSSYYCFIYSSFIYCYFVYSTFLLLFAMCNLMCTLMCYKIYQLYILSKSYPITKALVYSSKECSWFENLLNCLQSFLFLHEHSSCGCNNPTCLQLQQRPGPKIGG